MFESKEGREICVHDTAEEACDVTGVGWGGGAHRGHFCLPGVSPSGRRGTNPGCRVSNQLQMWLCLGRDLFPAFLCSLACFPSSFHRSHLSISAFLRPFLSRPPSGGAAGVSLLRFGFVTRRESDYSADITALSAVQHSSRAE